MDQANGTSQDTSTTENDSPSLENDQSTVDNTQNDLSTTDVNDAPVPATDAPESSPIGEALDAFSKVLGRPKFDEPKADKTTTPNDKPTTPPPKPVVARVYEGLDQEEARLFKHMGNEQYRMFYPKYIEAKTLKGELESTKVELEKLKSAAPSYVDHEAAYRLDPGYEKLSTAVSRVEAEAGYWQEQLAKVEAGEKFTPLSYNQQTGEYSYGEPLDASPVIKAQIMSSLSKAYNIHQRLQGELGTFQNTFKSQHQSYLSNMAATRTKLIGNLDANTVKALEKAAATKLDIFPQNVRNKPEVKMLAELLVVNEGLIKVVQDLKGKVAGKTIVSRTAKAAGPANVTNGDASGAKETIGSAMDAFKQAGMGRFSTMAG
jgi:hypothetical protein